MNCLKQCLRGAVHLAHVLWLCGYAVASVIASIAFFALSAQGADFLRLLSEEREASYGAWPRSAFYVGVVLWSLATWYSARLLTMRRLPGFQLKPGSQRYRVWIPRILGALAPATVGVAFIKVGLSGSAGGLDRALLWQGVWFLALTVALFMFYWHRRDLIPNLKHSLQAPVPLDLPALPAVSVRIISTAIALTFALLLLFVASPVAVPRFLGTPAIFVSAATSLVLSGGIVLTYLPLMRGYSGLTMPVLLFALVISGWNDNHRVREAQPTLEQIRPGDREFASVHFAKWLAAVQNEKATAEVGSEEPVCGPAGAQGTSDPSRYPVFLVAAAGGGIRAAYWTGVVLGTAADCVGKSTWRRHLYAVSGVSGGSLGAVVHASEIGDAALASKPEIAEHARRVLSADHLSPVGAFLLFPDLLQRFLPFALPSFDRARALELSWEESAEAPLGPGSLSRPFLALWTKPRLYSLPSLLLNATRVETGQRAIMSNLNVTKDFSDVVDLLAPQADPSSTSEYQLERLANVPVSTAAHLSARFTYVSPAARVEQDVPSGALWGRLVDGGYFENSGAETASELLRAIAPPQTALAATGDATPKKPIFIIVIISNDPHAPSALDSVRQAPQPPRKALSEIAAPIDALLNARDARGVLAEKDFISSALAANADSGVNADACILEFALAPPAPVSGKAAVEAHETTFADPPLGWSLSKLSIRAIETRLSKQKDQFRRIRESIRLGTCVS